MYALGVTLLVTASFSFYLLMPVEYRSKRLLAAYLAFVCLHHALSIVNVVWSGLPGADLDAHYFHLTAARALEHGDIPTVTVGTGFYEWVLYGLYWIFGSGKLLAQSLSVMLTSLTCVVVVQIARQVGSTFPAPWLVVLLALFPSLLFFTTLTFREVYQLLGLAASCFFLFRSLQSQRVIWLAPMFISLLFMGLFHHVLLAMGMFLFAVALSVFLVLKLRSFRAAVLSIGMTVFLVSIAGAAIVWKIPASSGNDYVEMLQHSGSIKQMIQIYRDAVDSANPRTSYGFSVETTSVSGIVSGLVRSYANYLTGPWIGEVNRFIDIAPFVSSLLRTLGIVCLLVMLVTGRMNLELWYLFFVFVTITFMWSVGTTNIGQAFRHNSITDWIPALWIVLFFHRAGRKASSPGNMKLS